MAQWLEALAAFHPQAGHGRKKDLPNTCCDTHVTHARARVHAVIANKYFKKQLEEENVYSSSQFQSIVLYQGRGIPQAQASACKLIINKQNWPKQPVSGPKALQLMTHTPSQSQCTSNYCQFQILW